MVIGEHIKAMVDEAVAKKGIMKKDIADKAGITAQTMSSIFKSDNVTLDTLMRISHACDSHAYWFIASLELPKMPVEAFKILEEIFFLPQKKREFFLRQMIEIKKLMDEIEKEAKDSDNK